MYVCVNYMIPKSIIDYCRIMEEVQEQEDLKRSRVGSKNF